MISYFKKNADSQWIGYDSRSECCNFQNEPLPAPYLRTEFEFSGDAAGANLAICGLGNYELFINGRHVGDHVLDPIVSVYDKHARYVVFDDIAAYLKPGRNAVGVVLGNGWYNCFTPDPWNLLKASWRDYPKMRMELRGADGKLLLGSHAGWKFTRGGPITFDGLRDGEWYDARMELGGWTLPGYDDSGWKTCGIVRSPGGLLERQTAVPVRVIETFEVTKKNAQGVYDLGVNIAGRVRLTVRGESGAKVTLLHTERLDEKGFPSIQNHSFSHLDNSRFQKDVYTLKGGGNETWEPVFTYHGFQYVGVTVEGRAEIVKLEARVIASDFEPVGNFVSGSGILNQIQDATRRSYLSNFVGIPTDCPHREKNGWTGDAQLASETGLCNFAAAASYRQWIDTMRDCQRPDGAFPGIVPSSGWGFNWGNGPAWDSAAFVIPWNVYLYTGDDAMLRDNYDAMKRYLDFVDTMCLDHLVQFGLGDWCPQPAKMPDERITNTAIYYGDLQMFIAVAEHFGHADDAAKYRRAAKTVRASFRRAFYRGNGFWSGGSPDGLWEHDDAENGRVPAAGLMTAMGVALYYGLCGPAERKATLAALVNAAKTYESRAYFGIIGAKTVPRVLADNGYASLAVKFFTQTEFPGWAYWILHDHATTLHEVWDTSCSWNHIMFGDPSAWCFRYLGGFRFDFARPGWKRLTVKPEIVPEIGSFDASHRGYRTQWVWKNGVAEITVTVPSGCTADVILPDGVKRVCRSGKHSFECAC